MATGYFELEKYRAMRRQELTDMLKPFVQATDAYGVLICRVTSMLGEHEPWSTQDRVIRDLMADAFDFLYQARDHVLSGYLNTAYPLARRAYETISLIGVSIQDALVAEKWNNFAKVGNAEVRRRLEKLPYREDAKILAELYDFYCLGTHPNRDLIPNRRLGEGNKFVLGAIGMPNLVLTVDYCMKLTDLWFWFGANISMFYKAQAQEMYPDHIESYRKVAKDLEDCKVWLSKQYKNALREQEGRD